ncbi:hypothetical protein KFL_003830040 [Klebsormidium nitens]|uniref:Uncharacterized protein n=1 Tax=Klebsormidium nitens TaxID=105231 RepID=A0A1Y1IA66_KLENI|nr:hypothetical protein KFL_003830040 [Klebsormidium nitens]|eukprot:GAQ87855.1 hypothetical protein KFL_003830040 [Klebsormidium nitens]
MAGGLSGPSGKRGSATKSGDPSGIKRNVRDPGGDPLAGELDGWKERALVAEKDTEKAQKVRGDCETKAAELRGRVRRLRDDSAHMREDIAVLRSTLEMQTLHGGAKGLEAEAAALKDALAREREQHRLENQSGGRRARGRRRCSRSGRRRSWTASRSGSGIRRPDSGTLRPARGARRGAMANDDLADSAASPIHVAAALAATSAADVRDSSESSNREFGGFSAGPTDRPPSCLRSIPGVFTRCRRRRKASGQKEPSRERAELVKSGAQGAKWYAGGLAVSPAADGSN